MDRKRASDAAKQREERKEGAVRRGEERTARRGGEGKEGQLATGGGGAAIALRAKRAHGVRVGEGQRWVSGRSRGRRASKAWLLLLLLLVALRFDGRRR